MISVNGVLMYDFICNIVGCVILLNEVLGATITWDFF